MKMNGKKGTEKLGNEFKRMRCPEGHIVTNTSIASFISGHGCFKL